MYEACRPLSPREVDDLEVWEAASYIGANAPEPEETAEQFNRRRALAASRGEPLPTHRPPRGPVALPGMTDG